MSGMAPIAQDPRACNPTQETHSVWNGGRLSFRNRRTVTFLFLATASAVVALLFFSHRLLGEEYFHPSSQPHACQSLDPHIPCVPELQADSPPPTVAIIPTTPSTTETVAVEPPVQPVVFSLVMVSEQFAKEGTILLKVRYMGF